MDGTNDDTGAFSVAQLTRCVCLLAEWAWILNTHPVEYLIDEPMKDITETKFSSLVELVTPLRLQRHPAKTFTENHFILDKPLTTFQQAKKVHEVARVMTLIQQILKENEEVVEFYDVGAGGQSLSQAVLHHFNVEVIAIDLSTQNHAKAQRKEDWLKKKGNTSISESKTVLSVQTNIQTAGQLSLLISNSLKTKENPRRIMLAGLHACGDLTKYLMESFISLTVPNAVLISIGCCYNLMQEDGWPLSRQVKELFPDFKLNRKQFAGAAQSTEMEFSDKHAQDGLVKRKRLFRAFLEKILVHQFPAIHAKVEGVGGSSRIKLRPPNSKDVKFSEYFWSNMSNLGLEESTFHLTRDELDLEAEAIFKQHDSLISQWYRLRQLIGPLIEELILIDRVLFLNEHNIKTEMFPLFDPSISPRNLCIVAKK